MNSMEIWLYKPTRKLGNPNRKEKQLQNRTLHTIQITIWRNNIMKSKHFTYLHKNKWIAYYLTQKSSFEKLNTETVP